MGKINQGRAVLQSAFGSGEARPVDPLFACGTCIAMLGPLVVIVISALAFPLWPGPRWTTPVGFVVCWFVLWSITAIRGNGVHYLARIRDSAPLTALISSSGERVNERTLLGKTALHFAASAGNIAATQILVAAGAEVDAEDWRGRTPLHCAAAIGRLQVAQNLLDLGADPTKCDSSGKSAADVAANAGFDLLADILRENVAR